jgi:hypothetical protein
MLLQGNKINSGCLYTVLGRIFAALREQVTEGGEYYMIKSFIIYNAKQILLGQSN